jgi:voltage-gated potassium channel
LALLGVILVVGTIGYLLLGFSLLNAVYQTVTTVATVGFREVEPLDTNGKLFTMALILVGVGAALYAFSVLIETFLEGRLNELLGRRRMTRAIESMADHVIICGWGRVGRSIAAEVAQAGRPLVVVDHLADRLADCPHPSVLGDATEDAVLYEAGIERAASLVAAVDVDAANSFIVLSARALRPELFLVARVRSTDAEEKMRRAGADRVVNPQHIGGARMAAFVLRPHVAEFLDVVMHERNLELCLEELVVGTDSKLAGQTIADSHLRSRTGALVLALRLPDGPFVSNPSPETRFEPGHVVIAIGTEKELADLEKLVAG